MSGPIVAVTIDTEEDNWGHYGWEGANTRNIRELWRAHEIFERYGARPTYLTNYAPVSNADSVAVLGGLSELESVEIGAHCHPWNTPPRTREGQVASMMSADDQETNRAKIATVLDRIEAELGSRARVFRAGRWALSDSVARALADLGIGVDCSVSPGIDWSSIGGPDYSNAPFDPYTFDPSAPTVARSAGAMIELPPTVGFLRGHPVSQSRRRTWLERSFLSKLKVVGILDRVGLLTRRWLSPETSDGATMVRLVDERLRFGAPFLQMTFHSSVLLPAATPYVANVAQRRTFLDSIDEVLRHLASSGVRFCTMSEAATLLQ